MSRSPWEDKLYETSAYRSQRHNVGNPTNTIFFILFIIFAVVAVFIIFMSIYLSTGGSQNESVSTSFFDQANAPAPEPQDAPPAEEPAPETPAESSTEAHSSGKTLVVQAGEGAGSIAARAGISVERLYELNPAHMTNGYWYANPGDVVNVD